MKKIWTEEDDNFILENVNKMTFKEMSEFLNCSISQLDARKEKLGIPKRKNDTLSNYDILYIKDNIDVMTYKELAKKLNITEAALRYRLKTLNIEHKKRVLTDEEINYIKENIEKLSWKEISSKLNCSEYFLKTAVSKLGINYNLKLRFNWSDEQLNYIKKNANIKSWKEMSEFLNCSIFTLKNKVKSLGIEVKSEIRNNWTEDEDNYILENANKITWLEMSKHLNCGIATVKNRAEKLGLKVEYRVVDRWTKEEEDLLKEYSEKYITKTIAKKLNKSILSVQKKAIKLGIVLHGKNNPWKKWMVDYLKDNIGEKSIRQIAMFIGLSEYQVRRKCSELNLEYESNRWTKEEEAILIEYAQKCHYSEITKLLPGKTKSAIICKARAMNLEIITESIKYKKEEEEYIKDNWGKISINQMAINLKIPRASVYRYKRLLNLPNVGQNIKWTDEALDELRRLAKDHPIKWLAKHFNTTKSAITTTASKNNIKLSDGKLYWTEEKVNELEKLAIDHTVNEISIIMKVPPQTINSIIRRKNILVKKDNARNQWTEDEVKTLIEMINNNASIVDIMKVIRKTDQTIINKCKSLNLNYMEFPKKRWTEEELELIKEDAKSLNMNDLVIKYQRSSVSIRAKLSKYNINVISLVDYWSEEELDKLRNMAMKGKDIIAIAKELNRTVNSVNIKLNKEKIRYNNRKKYWSKEEEKLLIEMWDEHNINFIVRKLKRSKSSIKNKAYKLGLKEQFLHSDALKIEEISEIFNVARQEIETTWVILGLPYSVEKVSEVSSYRYVLIDDLFKFLENNQFLYDGKDFEENVLGIEPEWVKKKRKHDFFYGFDYDRSSLIKKQLLQEKKYYLELEKEKMQNQIGNNMSLKKIQ